MKCRKKLIQKKWLEDIDKELYISHVNEAFEISSLHYE
jgi:hypothetical protein